MSDAASILFLAALLVPEPVWWFVCVWLAVETARSVLSIRVSLARLRGEMPCAKS